jgi:hypothetical protein
MPVTENVVHDNPNPIGGATASFTTATNEVIPAKNPSLLFHTKFPVSPAY